MRLLINRRSHIKELSLIICILAVSGILSFSLFGPAGYRDLQKARMELYERHVRVRALQIDIVRRTENTSAIDEDALKNSYPATLELLEKKARENGYAREGEYIQHIPE